MGKIPISSARLKGLIGMRGRKFKIAKWLPESSCYDCVSFKENKLTNVLMKSISMSRIQSHHWHTFSRVYPKAHTGSKHYDPLPWWVAGAQLVALNY